MNRKIRTICTLAVLLLVLLFPAGSMKVKAEAIRYSSPSVGVTPEIPLNSRGLPAAPDEPQVLGTSGRRTIPGQDAEMTGQSAAQDPLEFFDQYADCVKAVGFGFDGLLEVPENYQHILIRGKTDTMIEMVFMTADGSYILFRKGVGSADLAVDVKDYDEAVALRTEAGNYLLRYEEGKLRSITCYGTEYSTAVITDGDLNELCPKIAAPLTQALLQA